MQECIVKTVFALDHWFHFSLSYTVVPLLLGDPWEMENLALLEGWPLVRGILNTIIQTLFSEIVVS